jgi:5-methylcytosine-specific restriction endonuclease McrA
MSIVKTISEYFAGLPARSPRWPAVRGAHLKRNPTCAACGTKDKLEVHHVHPFHLFPNLELEPSNLLTLCETGGNCHLFIGHHKLFKSYNLQARKDAEVLLQKIKARP